MVAEHWGSGYSPGSSGAWHVQMEKRICSREIESVGKSAQFPIARGFSKVSERR